jgi:hypothetical protein
LPLGAPSTFHLCKTIVLENTAWDPALGAGPGGGGGEEEGGGGGEGEVFPTNSQYYGVIVQYQAKLHADKVREM